MKNTGTLLKVESVSKRFPGVVALNKVSLHLEHAEILSVIGENGAGKSTLMKILAGIQPPDEGRILIDGVVRNIDTVQAALENGIALIHQELNLCQNLDVGANIFLGREPVHLGMVDRARIQREARMVLDQVGLTISTDVLVENLTIGQQQMIEIAKAISTDARIVIMDEPTSSLSQRESSNLFEIIRKLKKRGVSIIYISHRLGEVELISDRVAVLRDGENAGGLTRDQISHESMVRHMVGRDLSNYYTRSKSVARETVMQAKNIRTQAHPDCEINFQVQAGEIVGIAGLVGAGRTELLTTLFGVTPAVDGEILIKGLPVEITSCQSAIQQGIGLVPEDRKMQGVILAMSVRENITLPTLESHSRLGFVDTTSERQLAGEMASRLHTRTPTVEQSVKFLSGGNQQKVVIAKWLASKPQILLMDEPTRGVDVGAKQEIYQLMDELAQNGVAILFVSSDMEEVLGMSDRMLVMHEGRISGELQSHEFSEENVMTLATGASRDFMDVSTTGPAS